MKGTDGRIEIDPGQAEVIKRIYRLYLAGETPPSIARSLNAEKVPRDFDKPWSGQYLLRILGNERYTGDCLLQKSFVADTGRQVRNKGQLDRYYVREHHPAIVSREVWEAAQRLREVRRTKRYPLTSMLRCQPDPCHSREEQRDLGLCDLSAPWEIGLPRHEAARSHRADHP